MAWHTSLPRFFDPVRAGTVSEALRAAIRRSTLNPAEIARRAGVDKAQLSRFLNNRASLSLEAVDRIATVLNWPLEIPPFGIFVTSKFRGQLCELEYRECIGELPRFLAAKPIGKPLDWDDVFRVYREHRRAWQKKSKKKVVGESTRE